MNDEQRRQVDQLHALTVDILRRMDEAIKQSKELPPGALPGILGEAYWRLGFVRDTLGSVLKEAGE